MSAINSDTCVTLSGRGDHLQQFSQSNALSQCKIRPTKIFSLYHNRRQLEGVQKDVLQDLRGNILLCSTPLHLIAPLFSNIDGKPIDSGQMTTFGEFCEKLLEMMLLEPVDWVAVEDNILAALKQSATAGDASYEILNFGPGYGMSGARHTLPDNLKIVAASIAESRPLPQDASGLLSPDDIAIVGMGVDLPGAPDADALWQNLVEGVNSCTKVKPNGLKHLSRRFLADSSSVDSVVKVPCRRLLSEERWSYSTNKVRELPGKPIHVRQRTVWYFPSGSPFNGSTTASDAPNCLSSARRCRICAGFNPVVLPGDVWLFYRKRYVGLHRQP